MKFNSFLLIVLCLFFSISLDSSGQNSIISIVGKTIDANHYKSEKLADYFFNYKIIELGKLPNLKETQSLEMQVELGGCGYTLDLWSSEIMDNTVPILKVQSESGLEAQKLSIQHYQGRVKNVANSMAAISIANDFFLGEIRAGDQDYIIEPLSTYDNTVPNNYYIV